MNNHQEILENAAELTSSGNFAEALKIYTTFFDETKGEPGLTGVRLSYCLKAWSELAQKYPPALNALKEKSDEVRRHLSTQVHVEIDIDDFDLDLFHEIVSINAEIGRDLETIELFQQFEANAELIPFFFIYIKRLLFKYEKYELCLKYSKTTDAYIEYWQDNFTRLCEYFQENSPEQLDTILKHQVEELNFQLAVLSKNNKLSDSKKIVSDIIRYLNLTEYKTYISKIDTALQ